MNGSWHAQGRRERGFTGFEFAVCVVLFAVLASMLLWKLLEYRAQFERAAAMQLVASARTAMAVRVARLAGQGGVQALEALAQENPLTWVAPVPANYQGEYYRPQVGMIKPGYWYYDRSDQSINFLLSNDTFSSETSNLLKFKVELLREPDPTSRSGRNGANHGLVLGQVHDLVASNNH